MELDEIHPSTGDAKISNDKNGSSENEMIGEPYVTKFEKARIIGARALQISLGAPLLIELEDTELLPFDMANIEFTSRVLPIGVVRSLPNGKNVHISIQELKDRDYISQMK